MCTKMAYVYKNGICVQNIHGSSKKGRRRSYDIENSNLILYNVQLLSNTYFTELNEAFNIRGNKDNFQINAFPRHQNCKLKPS